MKVLRRGCCTETLTPQGMALLKGSRLAWFVLSCTWLEALLVSQITLTVYKQSSRDPPFQEAISIRNSKKHSKIR